MGGELAYPCLARGVQRQGGPLPLRMPCREPGPHSGAGRSRPGLGACSERLALLPGPTSPRWTTPSAVWGSSSTCRGRKRRRMPGCRQGRSTTSSSRTSWWTSTSRCRGGACVHSPSIPDLLWAPAVCQPTSAIPALGPQHPASSTIIPALICLPATVLVYSRCFLDAQVMRSLD